jgi:hypothetical protein
MAVDVSEPNPTIRNEKRLIVVNENNQNKVVGYLPNHDYANLTHEKVQLGLQEHGNIFKGVAQAQANIRNQLDLIATIGTNIYIQGEEEDELLI